MQGPEESVEAICLLLHVCKGLPWGGNGSGVPEEGWEHSDKGRCRAIRTENAAGISRSWQ